MSLEAKYAVFAMCPTDIDVFQHTAGPFLYINQFKYCTHIIRIPIEFFVQMGESFSGPPSNLKLVLLSNVGRCGSTLLTQLFEQMPKTVAISGRIHKKAYIDGITPSNFWIFDNCE